MKKFFKNIGEVLKFIGACLLFAVLWLVRLPVKLIYIWKKKDWLPLKTKANGNKAKNT